MNPVDCRYNPFVNTVDGMSSLDLDYLTVSGQSLDIENIVPYTGASKAINLNAQRIFTSYTATAITDLTNKNYVDNTIFNATNGLGTFVADNFLQLNTSATQNISSLVQFSTSINTPNALISTINTSTLNVTALTTLTRGLTAYIPTATNDLINFVYLTSNYMTATTANATYETISHANSTYQTITSMTSYLTTATASASYETILHATTDNINDSIFNYSDSISNV